MATIKWNGREVTNPVGRFLVSAWAMLWVTLFLVGIAATSWIWIPFSVMLKLCGLRGFIINNPDGTITLSFTPDAFRRA